MGLLFRLASQWVAGETADAALSRAAAANARGIGAILNHLGEHYASAAPVDRAVREYIGLLDAIEARGLDATVSVKPTQLGVLLSEARCRSALATLVDRAARSDGFLWLDMESSETTDATLTAYEGALDRYPRVGVAIQANLRRTADDVARLLPKGARFRLCKGAYRESPEVAYTSRREIDASYVRLLRQLFAEGDGFAVATHDDAMIREALRLHGERPRTFEFQMLLGVREPLKQALAADGHRVVEYIPYGPQWLPYFLRRLRERPRNVVTVVRSFLSG